MRDLHNNLQPLQLISPTAATVDNTAWVSQIVDRQGFESLELVLNIGSLADADATFTVLVEHGDQSNLSDAAAVADADLLGTEALAGFTFADDNAVRKIGYVGSKRYLRVTVTPMNNAAAAYVSGVALLGRPHVAPTANPPA